MERSTLYRVFAAASLILITGCQNGLLGGFAAGPGVSLGDGSSSRAGGLGTFVADTALRTVSDKTNSDTQVFHKYVNSYAIPEGVTGVSGFSGSVSASGTGDSNFDFLFTVGFSPGGHCPASGSVYDTYPQDSVIPDYRELGTFIVKGLGNESHVEHIDIQLPFPIAVSGCIFTVMDGGYIHAGSLHMVADVTLGFVKKSGPLGALIAAGDEFCTGMTAGCELATELRSVTLAGKSMIGQSGTILSLYGSISEQATQATSNPWTATHSFYVDSGCSHMPSLSGGLFGPGDYNSLLSASLNSGTVKMLDVPFGNPSGDSSVMQSAIVQPVGVHVNAGDCIVHVVSVDSPSTPVSSETQIHALLVPDAASYVSPPIPEVATIPVTRFYNSQNAEHLFTANPIEVASNPTWISEGATFALGSPTGVPGSTLLNRCYVPGSGLHILSTDPNCEGLQIDSVLGAIFNLQYAGTVPLYRFYSPTSGAHFFTTFAAEALKTGFELEAVVGWVVPLTPQPATVIVPPSSPPSTPPATPATPPTYVNPVEPVYRAFGYNNGDHLYTVTLSEASSPGFQFELIVFHVYQDGGANLVPLYRCYSGGLHFLSRDGNCEGQSGDGFLGYIYAGPSGGAQELRRYWKADGTRLETIHPDEAAGMSDDGLLGYVN